MAYTKELMDVLANEVFADLERNFRDPNADYKSCLPTDGYDHAKFEAGEQKQGLFESILYDGLKVPVWLAALTADEAKKVSERAGRPVKYRVIRGHRRVVTVENINSRWPGKILHFPAIVYSDLTMAEEWALLADHGGPNKEEGLSELGQYRACINLFGSGQFTQEAIGRMLGETRGWAMRRIWLYQMKNNTPVETEFLKRFDPNLKAGDYFTFTYKDVEELYKAYGQDTKFGRDPMAEGSEFLKLWSNFAGKGSTSTATPKALPRNKIDERNAFIAGMPALEEYAKFVTGRGGSAADAASMYKTVHDKAVRVDSIQAELDAANERIATLESELADAIGQVTELTAEISALKAEKGKPVAGRKGR